MFLKILVGGANWSHRIFVFLIFLLIFIGARVHLHTNMSNACDGNLPETSNHIILHATITYIIYLPAAALLEFDGFFRLFRLGQVGRC